MNLTLDPHPNASFGLSSLLTQITNWASTRNHPLWDTYLVNMLTMVRNNQQKGKTISQLVSSTIADTELLITHIENYVEVDKLTLIEPKLILYIPNYVIPEAYGKKVSPSVLEQIAVVDKIRKLLPQRVYTQGALSIHIVHAGSKKKVPHLEVIDYLTRMDTNFRFKRTVIMTHVYLDLHIIKSIIDVSLFESFTAKVKPSREFNKKVFGLDKVPFTKNIHLLLGDSVFIKRSINRKEVQRLIDIATKDKWVYRPMVMVDKDLVDLNFQPKNFFNDFPL